MSFGMGVFFLSDSFCVVGSGQRRYVRSLAFFFVSNVALFCSAVMLSSSSGGDASVFSFLAACFALFKP